MNALTFITCGSVDDGKSTLIGRLLLDSKAILSDQLANASNTSHRTDDGQQPDLAAFTDGLQAEREQGITIDVAWRYFATPARKFIIGDTPGHVQYTRNMVTAATNADAAVVLVDATKLDWQNPALELLAQTRRHSLLVNRLRVPSVVFAINKLDAVDDPQTAFTNISAALHHFAALGQIDCAGTVPVSALMGYNVVLAHPGWAGYHGPSLLALLEGLPTIAELETISAAAQPPLLPHLGVQWVENRNTVPLGLQGRRIYWGRLAVGTISVGSLLQLSPSGQHAEVAQLLTTTRQDLGNLPAQAGDTVGVVL
ncbi:MAG: GTP-binding protein, partial [Burkholderiaceae bacterium]